MPGGQKLFHHSSVNCQEDEIAHYITVLHVRPALILICGVFPLELLKVANAGPLTLASKPDSTVQSKRCHQQQSSRLSARPHSCSLVGPWTVMQTQISGCLAGRN